MNNLHVLFVVFTVSVLTACSSLPSDHDAKPTYAIKDTAHTALGKEAAEFLAGDSDTSVNLLLNHGTDAFYERMALLTKAEVSVDVQYFIWHADLVGKLLLNGIVKAADRGVRVRMLLDDIYIDTDIESILYAIDQHENIEVRLFNPFVNREMRTADYVTDLSRINRRMHNKSFTADHQLAIIGGRNIGSEYFEADENNNFKDLDVITAGPVVAEVEKQFDVYWNSKVVYPVTAFEHDQATADDLETLRKELAAFAQSHKDSKYDFDVQDSAMSRRSRKASASAEEGLTLYRGKVKVIYDDPEKGLGKSEEQVVYLKSLLAPHLEGTKNTFGLVSPYFVPGDTGTEYLISLVSRGVKVSVITNSLASTDGIMAQSGYARHRIELLKGGVEIYELIPEKKTKASRSLRRSKKAKSGLHAKTYIFDRKEVFVGSFNFDQRSQNINTELGVIFMIPEMAEKISDLAFVDIVSQKTYKLELEIEHEDVDGIDVEMEKIIWVERKEGKEIRHTEDPGASAWRRFNEDVFSIMPIESQL